MSALTQWWVPRGRVAGSGLVTPATPATSASTTVFSAATGLADVTLTATAGRLYRIEVMAAFASTSTAGGIHFRIFDGGASAPTNASTGIGTGGKFPGAGTASVVITTCWVLPDITGLTAGTHRLGLFFHALTTGTATALDTSTFSSLTVYDMGPG